MPIVWVGLGNPGEAYANTRHNVGFLFIDAFAQYLGIQAWKEKFSGLVSAINHERLGKIIVLKPQTTMNISGRSVAACLDFFKLTAKDIIVIHDDLDLSLGVPKLKHGGSSGGHNGLRDITKVLGRDDYLRIRIGIDRPANKDMVRDYVLGRFSADEKQVLQETFTKILRNIDSLFLPTPVL